MVFSVHVFFMQHVGHMRILSKDSVVAVPQVFGNGVENAVIVLSEACGTFLYEFLYCGYAVLLCGLIYFYRDYKGAGAKTDWLVYFLLSVCALLREAGIQHHLSSTDTTPFKSKFFLNPENPLYEKIVFGIVLLLVFGMVIYLAVKYTKHLVTSFFKMNTVTWSTAVLCCDLVFAKFADRFPGNWRHAHDGLSLPREQIEIWSLLEESSEIFLPLTAFIILWQYHLLLKSKQP